MKKSEREDTLEYVLSPRLELTGNTRCEIEGIKGIPVYNGNIIKIDFGKYCVSFFGDGLYIRAFSSEGATVEGTIVSMEFCENG